MFVSAAAVCHGRVWNYSPAMQLYMRMLVTAYLDTRSRRGDGQPSDEALLARDWIASGSSKGSKHSEEYVSFDQCCEALDINPEAERVQLLSVIDSSQDFDTDEAWQRLEELRHRMPESDGNELFAKLPEYARVVPVIDQMSLMMTLCAGASY